MVSMFIIACAPMPDLAWQRTVRNDCGQDGGDNPMAARVHVRPGGQGRRAQRALTPRPNMR